MNNPLKARVGSRRRTADGSSATRRDVAFNVEVREERGIDVGVGGATTAEVHGIWTVKTHTEVFSLNVTRVL